MSDIVHAIFLLVITGPFLVFFGMGVLKPSNGEGRAAYAFMFLAFALGLAMEMRDIFQM